MIKIAAVGDLHTHETSYDFLKPGFRNIGKKADVLILAGDLTSKGRIKEARILVEELSEVKIPIVAVLGNHDFHNNNNNQISEVLLQNGIHILDGGCITLKINDKTVGFTGTKGFCGGYGHYSIPDFGEQSLRLLVEEIEHEALKIKHGLMNLDTDFKIVVLHYSPTIETLKGENQQIYFFLGGSILSKPIDSLKPDIVFHGHTHYGTEKGFTEGGIPVRNVSMPMIKKPYSIVSLPLAKEKLR
jgi:Icc-related predicted phosphoesterase